MASKKKLDRFIINADGKERVLFGTELTKDGSVAIYIKHGKFFDSDPENDVKISKYSIHPSAESETGVNTLKYTSETKGGSNKAKTKMFFTECIKQKSGFCSIYSKLCSNLLHERYDLKESRTKEKISLTSASLKSCSLFYSIFVSHPQVALENDSSEIFNSISKVIGDFRITVVWAYVPLTPLTFSHYLHSEGFEEAKSNPPSFQSADFNALLLYYANQLRLAIIKKHKKILPEMSWVYDGFSTFPPLFKTEEDYFRWFENLIERIESATPQQQP